MNCWEKTSQLVLLVESVDKSHFIKDKKEVFKIHHHVLFKLNKK